MDIEKYINEQPFLRKLFMDFEVSDLHKMEIVYYASDMTVIKRYILSNYLYLIVNVILGIFHELDSC